MPKTHSYPLPTLLQNFFRKPVSPVKFYELSALLTGLSYSQLRQSLFSESDPPFSFSSEFTHCFNPQVSKKTVYLHILACAVLIHNPKTCKYHTSQCLLLKEGILLYERNDSYDVLSVNIQKVSSAREVHGVSF